MKLLIAFAILLLAGSGAISAESKTLLPHGEWVEQNAEERQRQFSMTVHPEGWISIKHHIYTAEHHSYVDCKSEIHQVSAAEDILIIPCTNTKKLKFKLIGSLGEFEGVPQIVGTVFIYLNGKRGRSYPVSLTRVADADNTSFKPDTGSAGAA